MLQQISDEYFNIEKNSYGKDVSSSLNNKNTQTMLDAKLQIRMCLIPQTRYKQASLEALIYHNVYFNRPLVTQ